METLGSTTFICTDKTGTLTRNEMAVLEVWTPAGSISVDGEGYAPDGRVTGSEVACEAARRAAGAARTCSTGHAVLDDGRWRSQGDPMEAAIDALARRLGSDSPPAVRQRFPFDPRRRRESVVAGDVVLVKGAPDSVLPRCGAGGDAEAALDDLATRGLRVLAVAERPSRRERPASTPTRPRPV